MAEFFLELFSEEIPPILQKNARVFFLENFQKLFEEKNLKFKKSATYSTPNRLIVLFEGLDKEMIDLMAESGCQYIDVAIESGSERVIRKIVNKN